MPNTFPILFEDDHFVAINKPTGILVHRTNISEDTVFVLQLLRDQIRRKVYPVHRLDRGTSGVLIFGKSKEAAAELAIQFRTHSIEKIYWAIIRGFVEESDVIDYPLAPEPHKEKQEAVTYYSKLKQITFPAAIGRYPTARYSSVEIAPKTGRRHQIRRHFSHLRHPIIGDKKHGDVKHNKYFRDVLSIPRMLLHARKLKFYHFERKEDIEIIADLDDAFLKAKEILGL